MQSLDSSDFMKGLSTARPKLIKQATLLLGSAAEAEDVVHSAFERALHRRHEFVDGEHVTRWLAMVTRNLAIDLLRRPDRRVAAVDVSYLPEPIPDPRPWWDQVSSADVRRALSRCSTILREAFELHHYAGLSIERIANQTGAPPNTVGTRLHRARAHVRRVLESEVREARGGGGGGAGARETLACG